MKPILDKHMPLSQNSSRSPAMEEERKKDHYSHFILRLAFSSTEDLRRRFTRLESSLFRLRFQNNDARDRQDFVASLDFEWEKVSEEEKREFSAELLAVNPGMKKDGDEGWFKVDWEKVPELVESRRVFLRRGKAFVPAKEQTSMVVSEFSRRLDQQLEVKPSPLTYKHACISITNLPLPPPAHSPRPPPPRRRRPPLPHPPPPLPKLRLSRLNLR